MPQGLRVYPQAHTNTTSFIFTLADWNLFDDSEAWREATLGSTAERLMKLADPSRRAKLKEYADGERMVTGDLENFVIEKVFTPRFKHLEGMTLRDAGKKMAGISSTRCSKSRLRMNCARCSTRHRRIPGSIC